jgi:hypothetical protein
MSSFIEKVKLASDISKRSNNKYKNLLRFYSVEALRALKTELDQQQIKKVEAPISELVKVAKQRKQYRPRISTAELRTIYRQQQEENKITKLKNEVSNFTANNTAGSFRVKKINETKFKAVLDSIQLNPNFIYTLQTGNKNITIKQETINRIRNLPFTQIIQENQQGSDEQFIYQLFSQDEIIIKKQRKQRLRRGGSFFPHLNMTDIDLSKYQIYNTIDKNNYKNNCLIHALIESKLFTEKEINNIKLLITDRHYPVCKLNKIAEILKCKISLTRKETNRNQIRIYGSGNKKINIGLLEEHYFINDKTNYNSYAIKNYYDVCLLPNYNTIYRKRGNNYDRENKPIDSFDLINLMLENNLFKTIDLSSEILDTQYYDSCADSISSLEYSNSNVRKMKLNADDKQYNGIYFSDFETTTPIKNTKYNVKHTKSVHPKIVTTIFFIVASIYGSLSVTIPIL